MIKYNKLWETAKMKGITKYKLNKDYHVSKSQLHRLQHNQSVSTNTLDRLCNILDCRLEDIAEQVRDDNVF